ncbi:DUF4870 domain-containing protein [Staphylococcus caeli]|uniref:Uncharacterized protein conserved in bacteria n=1 Tax=Staphylococcus caeli TaxID=2201815 RepID=A0A1D4K530_9STAP|nr:DUF4870 domain-containing protein [Staphylococcus caeli]SCS69070.1 Uncharacterized protein conserved in bacteria [Staphylococcus caeli]SCT49320.1 Uncharacterized protein conserved in bacteria [Staphylococcus caeli]
MNFLNQSKDPNAFPNVSQNDKTMAMLIWILNIFTGFIGPLIIWLMKKDESEYLNKQGKNYLNYAISYSIYIIASLILTIILIGYIPLFILSVAGFVYAIIGIITVNKGEDFVVPLTIEIIK